MPDLLAFQTLRPANPIFCHQEFLEKLEGWRTQPLGKRAGLLMQRLAVDSTRVHYKATRGDNQGWRRSRLGGASGSHFYAWWAPKGAAPLKNMAMPDGSILLRDIRHHDDHSTCRPQRLDDSYLPVSVGEIRLEDYSPAPWTASQAKFATARSSVRLLKGHPGSGKTTALLHAADQTGAERVLYVTYSAELAALARAYFDRFCEGSRQFHVVTVGTLVRELLRSNQAAANDREMRRKFRGDLLPHVRSLGPWVDHYDELYDEFYAHLVGGVSPVEAGRFEKCELPKLSDKAYRTRRMRFLGQSATPAALEAAVRLERSGAGTLAQRYFPELDLAWNAASMLASKGPAALDNAYSGFDCIAIDECQDLTVIEAMVLVLLAGVLRARKNRPITLLLAGDEAQTVRPTDFEWGWMSDILHSKLSTPQEFQLVSNLRSPRRIATIVNHVWDLYSQVDKRDRPSGSGLAEIEDDATDQVFYCTATPGPELNSLLSDLSVREGLAVINVQEKMPEAIPEQLRARILTASEAKGLDFHTVCVIEGGKLLDGIRAFGEERMGFADLESIRRRLAIDRLRVALSRPTERLIWLDIQPPSKVVLETMAFLNYGIFEGKISPTIPATVLTALEEEQLDVEERVQRCQQDARQYLSIRPELSWSRAQQAVALLGDAKNPAAVKDLPARQAAHLTLAEICLRLAMQRVKLPPELGSPNLWEEAARAAAEAGKRGLGWVIRDLALAENASVENRANQLGQLIQKMTQNKDDIPPWLLVEIAPRTTAWIESLEGLVSDGDNAISLTRILPPFYELLGLPDAAKRTQRLEQRSIQSLIKTGRHAQALEILKRMPARNNELEGECLAAMGQHAEAAKAFIQAGKLKDAINCYRAIPDFEAALKLMSEVKDHPAAEAYAWLKRVQAVIAERPENFSKVMTAAEKNVMESMLEQALGTARKKAVPRAAKAPAVDPVVKRRVSLYLHEHKQRFYCDDCLAVLAQAGEVEKVAKVTKELAKSPTHTRRRIACFHCWKIRTNISEMPAKEPF